jgi:hypothetical protein
LGPDASHATNKPWLTIGKLLGAAGMASGDTAYLSPAGPFREQVTVNMTSPVAETKIFGDYANAKGFKTSGGVLVTPGQVIWTAHTTNDTTIPGTSSTLNLNGRDFLTFESIVFIGANNTSGCINASTVHSSDITFRNCAFYSVTLNANTIRYTASFATAANWLIERCIILVPSGGAGVTIVATMGTGADYDLNFVIKNCLITGVTNGIGISGTGTGANFGGGVDVLGCTVLTSSNGILISNASISSTIKCTAFNNHFVTSAVGLSANNVNQLTEDYNRLNTPTARTNVTAGANSITGQTHAPLFSIGQEILYGMQPRPYLSPIAGSPLLGFGTAAAFTDTVDMLNRARPEGGGSTSKAVGAYERHDTAAKETTTVRTGSNSIKITGPGSQNFDVPVDASATIISIYTRFDTNHGTTNRPQMILTNGTEIGVADQTITAAGAVDTWEQLSTASFTPTAKGVVSIRLVSRAAAGSGIAYFDDFAIT